MSRNQLSLRCSPPASTKLQIKRCRSAAVGTRQLILWPNHRVRFRAITSYTASRKPAGTSRKTAINENGSPSKVSIRNTASDRSRISLSSTTMMEPAPPTGSPLCTAKIPPDSDCRAAKRKTSLRSNRIRKSTQPLQKLHSPSKTTTACCVTPYCLRSSWIHPTNSPGRKSG